MALLKVAFLDVGHGDFVYAETPLGDNLVIDIGTGDVVPSQFLSKIQTISEVQVTHPHTDHIDDIVEFSKKKTKSFRCPRLDKFKDEVIGWKKSDKEKILKLREMKRVLAADNKAVTVGKGFDHTVWFPDDVDYSNPNTASIVTTLEYAGVKILFGGDLPDSGWQSLLKNTEFVKAISGTTVFKVPHHGRTEGCSQALFDIISPQLCIISDKPLAKDNKNTVATDWYTKRSSGCNVVGCTDQRKVLTTRSDKSIFMEVNDAGKWWVHRNLKWK